MESELLIGWFYFLSQIDLQIGQFGNQSRTPDKRNPRPLRNGAVYASFVNNMYTPIAITPSASIISKTFFIFLWLINFLYFNSFWCFFGGFWFYILSFTSYTVLLLVKHLGCVHAVLVVKTFYSEFPSV